MAGVSEVGAADVKLDSFKCSIKRISVSTKWKAPTSEVSGMVTSTVYDAQAKEKKNIYLISSPEGEKVTVRIERDPGQCKRNYHKKYRMIYDDYKRDPKQDASWGAPIIPASMPMLALSLINTAQKKEEDIKAEETFTVKCYELGGAFDVFKYLKLPIPLQKSCLTAFSYNSCKEGPISFDILSYPDIKFEIELTVGTKESKKKQGGFSHFERKSMAIKSTPQKLGTLMDDSLDTDVKFCPPTVSGSIKYNGDKDELSFKFDFDTEKEILNVKYKHDSHEVEFGSEAIQIIVGKFKRVSELAKVLKKVCNVQFLKDLLGFDTTNLAGSYSPYSFKLNPPSVYVSFSGQYHTSKDLLRIGKLLDICVGCKPLVSVSLTIDLLFMLISAVTAGAGTGIYVLLKNLDKVVKFLLGDDYKKEYKDTKPFAADVYINLVLTGAVNGDVHWFYDTTEKTDANSSKGAIEGVIKVDLEAGAKMSLDVMLIAVEGEVSGSGSSGIKLRFGLESRILQGEGLALTYDTIFLGLKIKYCVKGKVGLMKTWGAGGSLADGEKMLLSKKTIEALSGKMTFLEDNAQTGGGTGKSFNTGLGSGGGTGNSFKAGSGACGGATR